MKNIAIGTGTGPRALLLTLAVSLAVLTQGGPVAGEDEGAGMEIWSVDEGRLVTVEPVERTPEEWRERLTEEQFRILREDGTERAFTGPYWDSKQEGVYRCAGCGTAVFLSTTKFESGTGWPSFTSPVHPANIGTSEDRKLWMVRTEVHCARCGGHLGHVFEDGPEPTGLRYCLNGHALDFEPRDLTEVERPAGS